MKRSLYIFLIIISALVLTTCKKRPELKIYNLELSEESVAVTPYTATITANYSYPGSIPQIKVYTSTSSSMSDAIETDAVLDNNKMTAIINDLTSDTKYYYRFRYSNGINLIYTDIKDFTTGHAVVAPIIITIPITSVTSSSAVSGGTVTDNGGADVIEKGVCWSTSQNPTIDDSHTSDGTGNGAFVSTITGLLPNTLYYVRSYATNSETTGYGNELSFTTSSSLASITTKEVTNITPTSAHSGGVVTNSGGLEITSRGVCWSTEHNPTIDDSHSEDGVGIGEFGSEIIGLVSNVTYYVRAYATSSYGTSYGDEVEFTTQMGMPTVTTKSVTSISASSATCGGDVTNSGGGTITARGVCWSTTQNPTIANSHTTDGTGTGEFTSSITGLDNNITYYVRAYATNSNSTSYGEERSFTTQEGLAFVTTTDVTNVTATSATSGGEVTNDGGFSITARGVCWSTSQNPTTIDDYTSDGTGMGAFSSSITNLTYNTTYYLRAYATNSKGTSYGEEKTFTTSKLAPTITTTEVTSITTNSAISGGNVTSDGGATVTARGVCYGTSQNPTISGTHTSDGNGSGEFTSTLTDLTANTTYYVRAYATNSEGTSYGAQKTFTTTQSTSLPEVTTYQVTEIGATTATCGGYVVSDGGSTVTSRGVCWSTEHNPVLNTNYMTHDGSGTGEFTSSITGLSPNTTYYVRAYASNSVGTNYGEEKSFTTNDGLPVVTTAEVTSITQTTAICGGNVTSDGGLAVTSRGVVWDTSPNPVLNIYYMTNDGSGTGVFTSNITDLSPNTTYYVRAYASNSAGTSYGEQKTFTTGQTISLPTVTTAEVSDITSSTATCGGNVTSDGGATVTARGVCWSTSSNPTISDPHTTDGTGTGLFTSSITGLTANTTYHVRAYATNSQGTAYGDDITFATQSGSQVPAGAINGLFTINANGDQVYFSQGNLQYQASTNTWRFAENQWNYVGGSDNHGSDFPGNVEGSSNNGISSTYSGWIDLFGWGTSGYNHGALCYQPWSYIHPDGNSYYYAFGNPASNLTGIADWGYNAISNGGNTENQWRTPAMLEWAYIVHQRNTSSGLRFAKAIINDVNGVILLPDNWNSDYYPLNNTNALDANFSDNTIDAVTWSNYLEENGAVFLPTAYSRNNNALWNTSGGYYWSTTREDYAGSYGAYRMYFNDGFFETGGGEHLWEGLSVRLVQRY